MATAFSSQLRWDNKIVENKNYSRSWQNSHRFEIMVSMVIWFKGSTKNEFANNVEYNNIWMK